ncbi:hypothetical protein Pcac1_g13979 [Phytophthora cactorum]|nr:hypothetical protein Pcac1_g13979 [Phytophthora cactorum]RAW23212.1 hypothetical protein PC110_g20352 [Phytophthora cactorum]
MIAPAALSTTPQEFMTLSFRGFAAWWFVILGNHLVTFFCAKFHWMFGSTLLRYSLDSYDVGMSATIPWSATGRGLKAILETGNDAFLSVTSTSRRATQWKCVRALASYEGW